MYRFISRKNKTTDQQWSQNSRKLFKKNIRNFCIPGFESCLLEYKFFLSLGLESSISQNIRIFVKVGYFLEKI